MDQKGTHKKGIAPWTKKECIKRNSTMDQKGTHKKE